MAVVAEKNTIFVAVVTMIIDNFDSNDDDSYNNDDGNNYSNNDGNKIIVLVLVIK